MNPRRSKTLARCIAPLLLCGLAAILSSCETIVDPSDVPYIEQMVVQGIITAGAANDTIHMQRTLPLTELYSPSKAALSDVEATICDEQTGASYVLTMTEPGAYIAQGLIPVAGRRYTLTAAWNGKHVTASTTVPLPAVIDTVIAVETRITDRFTGQTSVTYPILAIAHPVANLSFGMRYDLRSMNIPMNSFNYSYLFDRNLLQSRDTMLDGRLYFTTDAFFASPASPPYTGTVNIYTYDAPYYDYFTHAHESSDDDPFSTPGETVHWNVQGDGIGMFLSRSIATWTGIVYGS